MFGRRSAHSHQPTITRHRDSAEERKGGGSAQLLGTATGVTISTPSGGGGRRAEGVRVWLAHGVLRA